MKRSAPTPADIVRMLRETKRDGSPKLSAERAELLVALYASAQRSVAAFNGLSDREEVNKQA